MLRQPPELRSPEVVPNLERIELFVEFWADLDPNEDLDGDDGFPRNPNSLFLAESPLAFQKFWKVAQRYPQTGLFGNGDEILCGRDADASWDDNGYVHLTEDTISVTIVAARFSDYTWRLTKPSPGGFEDSTLSVGQYLISYGLMRLAEEPRKYRGTWGEVDNVKSISDYLLAGSRCIWDADLWGKQLRVYYQPRGILWYILNDDEICVTARNREAFRWFDGQWWCS